MRILTLLALLVALPMQARAQEEPIPSPAALERMCSPRGAMQFTFGQTGVPLSSKLESTLGQGFALPASLAPFTKAQPRSTEWSGRFMEMTYSLRIDKADAARAPLLISQLKSALIGQAWKPAVMSADNPPLYLMGVASDHVFSRSTDAGGPRGHVLLSLDYQLGELTMVCARDDLLYDHAQEAFGKLPPGTPRPLVPEIAVPTVTKIADCNQPEIIDQVKTVFGQGGPDRFMATMLARTTYRDRLTSWMIWKLESSGKITPTRLLNLSMSAIGKGSPGGDPFAAMALISEMLPMIETMGKASNSKDPVQMCQSLIPFHALMAKADAITFKQTQATQAALTAEAKRLGVSLD